ncbi:MAG: YrbL family protein [Rariglobus sp.]
MNGILKLSHLKPLAQGRMRLVFEHPDDRSLLIKVIRPDVIERRWGSGAAWYKRRRRYGRYTSYIREIQEYLAAYARHGKSLSFAQKITGLVETDMGLGLVMEAVRSSSGELAPSLMDLISTGTFDEEARRALDVFLQQLVDSNLLISDMNPGNMVYLNKGSSGGRFVLIDGIGASSAIPFKSWIRWLNRRSKLGRVKRLRLSILKREAALRSRRQTG